MSELNQKEVNEQMYLFVKRWLDDLPFEESKKVPVMAIGYCLARLSKQDELLKEQEHKDKMFHALEEDWKRLKEQEHEVCENCPYKLEDIGDFYDGYHTFNDLYYQRCVLFATIVNMNKSKAWKTRCHEDGEPCFGGGWFLVTVETPEGAYGYHYEDKYWNMFDCEELPKAKRWDGYTDKDVGRLLTLK